MAKLELQIGDKTYDKAWVDDLTSTSQISTDPASINYGVIPSTGSAKLRDLGGAIRADIEAGALPASNAKTLIRINDNQIQEHTTSDSDYDVINRELNLDFSDRLSLLDKVTYGGMPLRDYSMSAYEMLDEVIGSYGEYIRECPINWTAYTYKDRFSVNSGSNKIEVTTSGGYEIIGTPIYVVAGKKYKLDYSIGTSQYTALDGTNGVPIQILSSEPVDGNCSDIAIASVHLSTGIRKNIGTLEFEPTTNIVYLVLNFGWAADDQTTSVTISKLALNGKSLAVATANRVFSRTSIYGGISANQDVFTYNTKTITSVLSSITIVYPYLEKATYRETIEKFCVLAQCTATIDEDGEFKFYSARPCAISNKAMAISPRYQISNLKKTLFVKNKVDGVDIKQDKAVVNLDIGSAFQTDNTNATDFLSNTNNQSASAYEDSNITGYLNVYAKAYINSYYTSFSVVIPKKREENKKSITRILSGADSDGNPNVKYVTTYTKNVGTATMPRGQSSTTIDDITLVQTSSSNGNGDIPISYEQTNTATGGGPTTATATFVNLSNNGQQGIFLEDDTNYYVTLLLLCGGLFVGVNGSQELSTTKQEFLGEKGQYEEYIPQKVEVTFYGDVQTISFEEADLSTSDIENANNAVSVPTNELMQNESAVVAIRDNIMSDYANGVQTATIDLFCGTGDWEHGEILQPNSVASFDGSDDKWRVTGRTFKYAGAPTLSLELQNQKAWHTLYEWTGSIVAKNPSDTYTSTTFTVTVPLPEKVDPENTAIWITTTIEELPYNGSKTTRKVAFQDLKAINQSIQTRVGALKWAKYNANVKISEDGAQLIFSGNGNSQDSYYGYVKEIEVKKLQTAKYY